MNDQEESEEEFILVIGFAIDPVAFGVYIAENIANACLLLGKYQFNLN